MEVLFAVNIPTNHPEKIFSGRSFVSDNHCEIPARSGLYGTKRPIQGLRLRGGDLQVSGIDDENRGSPCRRAFLSSKDGLIHWPTFGAGQFN
jgi:hypothetical protein